MSAIPQAVKTAVWARADGHCEGPCGCDLVALQRKPGPWLRREGYDPRRALGEYHHLAQQAHAEAETVVLNGERMPVHDPRNVRLWCQLCHRAESAVQAHEAAKGERIGQPPALDAHQKPERLARKVPPVRGVRRMG